VNHLPGCKFKSYNQAAEEMGYEPFWDEEWGEQAGFMLCADGCPRLEAIKEFGRKKAEELNW
jgi:hypothetical protein